MDLVQKILDARMEYGAGCPSITDPEYDALEAQLRALHPNHPILMSKDATPDGGSVIPYPMPSLSQVDSAEEVYKWLVKIGAKPDDMVVLMPKFDGISLETNGAFRGWTGGDGFIGRDASDRISTLRGNPQTSGENLYVGEAIIPRKEFEKYASEYSNPRNMVASLFRSTVPPDMSMVTFVKYKCVNFTGSTKADMLDYLNMTNEYPVDYLLVRAQDAPYVDYVELYRKWGHTYELDGIVLEMNDSPSKQYGWSSSWTPNSTVKFKGHFDSIINVNVEGVSLQPSATGELNPVIHINPVKLSGVIISKVNGVNARHMSNVGGKGAIIKIKRSGGVIPKLVAVVKSGEPYDTRCPACGEQSSIVSTTRGVHHCCLNKDCVGIAKARVLHFIKVMGIPNIKDGMVNELFSSCGVKSIDDLIHIDSNPLIMNWLGEKVSSKVVSSVNKSLSSPVSIERIMAASTFFPYMGEKSLRKMLIGAGADSDEEITYARGIKEFETWYAKHRDKFNAVDIHIDKVKYGDALSGVVAVFTQFRSAEMEKFITDNGGVVKGDVSKLVTHLIVPDVHTRTSKFDKATALGISIITKSSFCKLYQCTI